MDTFVQDFACKLDEARTIAVRMSVNQKVEVLKYVFLFIEQLQKDLIEELTRSGSIVTFAFIPGMGNGRHSKFVSQTLSMNAEPRKRKLSRQQTETLEIEDAESFCETSIAFNNHSQQFLLPCDKNNIISNPAVPLINGDMNGFTLDDSTFENNSDICSAKRKVRKKRCLIDSLGNSSYDHNDVSAAEDTTVVKTEPIGTAKKTKKSRLKSVESGKRNRRERVNGKYLCTFPGCFEMYANHEHVTDHELQHTVPDGHFWPCSYCSQKFKWRHYLRLHVKMKHTQQVLRPCDENNVTLNLAVPLTNGDMNSSTLDMSTLENTSHICSTKRKVRKKRRLIDSPGNSKYDHNDVSVAEETLNPAVPLTNDSMNVSTFENDSDICSTKRKVRKKRRLIDSPGNSTYDHNDVSAAEETLNPAVPLTNDSMNVSTLENDSDICSSKRKVREKTRLIDSPGNSKYDHNDVSVAEETLNPAVPLTNDSMNISTLENDSDICSTKQKVREKRRLIDSPGNSTYDHNDVSAAEETSVEEATVVKTDQIGTVKKTKKSRLKSVKSDKYYRRERVHGRYLCTFLGCTEMYASLEHITDHELQHTSPEGYFWPCSHCSQKFKWRHYLRLHVKLNHRTNDSSVQKLVD